jgi:hypothetical protein
MQRMKPGFGEIKTHSSQGYEVPARVKRSGPCYQRTHYASPPLAAISATAPATRDRSAIGKSRKTTRLAIRRYGRVMNGPQTKICRRSIEFAPHVLATLPG